MNIQLKQLDEANQAWQQYQQNQLVLLHDRLKLNDVDNLSFEDIVQQIENRFNDLNNQLIELENVKSKIFSFHTNQYYLFYRVETNVDVDRLQKQTNELQDVDTQTEDNEKYQARQEDQSQEVCFFNYKNIFRIILFIDSKSKHCS
jgi:hypothetical protein